MYKMFLGMAFASVLLSAQALASVVTLPMGIQSNLTQMQIESWGWSECSRSDAIGSTSMQSVLNACDSGSHLMMALWDESLGLYGIAGAGDFNVVTAVTFDNHSSDSNVSVLNNWSNGLNWYRTSGYGSWGFTSIASVALFNADINLRNGLRDYSAQGTSTSEQMLGEAARGLSYHVNQSGNLNRGWAYNVTGNDHTYIGMADQRVFFTATVVPVNPVPAPQSFMLLGIAVLALAGLRARVR